MEKQNSKNKRKKRKVSIGLLIALVPALASWGIFGHEHINHAAVLALPEPLQTFFYNHIDFITQESTVPDLRKYTLNDKSERPRHFINLEHYGSKDNLPKSLRELNEKYLEAEVIRNGILPWYIMEMMEKLTAAFRNKRKTEILFLASDLGHYIADAHMPLHTTVNHDGELTDQKGIHAFWEAQLPDLFGKTYYLKPPSVKYISNVDEEIWRIIFSSHNLAETLLLTEKKLSENFSGEIYRLDSMGKIERNKFNQPVHSSVYAKEYHRLLNGMVEKQMVQAIHAISNLWYTAWINAGSPNLTTLDPKELSAQNAKLLKKELELWDNGKLKELNSESEF